MNNTPERRGRNGGAAGIQILEEKIPGIGVGWSGVVRSRGIQILEEMIPGSVVGWNGMAWFGQEDTDPGGDYLWQWGGMECHGLVQGDVELQERCRSSQRDAEQS